MKVTPMSTCENDKHPGVFVTNSLAHRDENDIFISSQRSIQEQGIDSPEVVVPELIEASYCDACPFCADICSNPLCKVCERKSQNQSEKVRREANRCTNASKHYKNTSFTPCQIRRHDHPESAWLVCGTDIYDATKYIAYHPGGDRSILRRAGGFKDCTEDMNFHSKRAIKLWKGYRIGTVRPCPGRCVNAENDSHGEQCVIS